MAPAFHKCYAGFRTVICAHIITVSHLVLCKQEKLRQGTETAINQQIKQARKILILNFVLFQIIGA